MWYRRLGLPRSLIRFAEPLSVFQAKHLGTSGSTSKLKVENLTRYERSFVWSTKEGAKVNTYKYVWHRNGDGLIGKEDGEQVPVVKSGDDLEELEQNFYFVVILDLCSPSIADKTCFSPNDVGNILIP